MFIKSLAVVAASIAFVAAAHLGAAKAQQAMNVSLSPGDFAKNEVRGRDDKLIPFCAFDSAKIESGKIQLIKVRCKDKTIGLDSKVQIILLCRALLTAWLIMPVNETRRSYPKIC